MEIENLTYLWIHTANRPPSAAFSLAISDKYPWRMSVNGGLSLI